MDIDQLVHFTRQRRMHVLPFVGSGLTIDAGAPDVKALAQSLAARCEVESDTSLGLVTAAAVKQLGRAETQHRLAEIVLGWRMRPTTALTALAGARPRVILTTNYDNAIEVAAASRGIETKSLLANDPAILDEPPLGTLHVVHLHGLPDTPTSLVLPGLQMTELVNDSVFTTFIRTTMIRYHALYLGYSFAGTEEHLRAIVAWINETLPDRRRHFLVQSQEATKASDDDRAFFMSVDLVDVVNFDSGSDGFEPVERVAVSLAPRSSDHADTNGQWDPVTWVWPALFRRRAEDDADAVAQRASVFDPRRPRDGETASPKELPEEDAAAVIGGPGMGKSMLLRWLPHETEQRCATAYLRHYAGRVQGGDPVDGLVDLLADARGGGPLEVEALDEPGLVVLADGLDEVRPAFTDAAVDALIAARRKWPGHRWIVTSRPSAITAALIDAGFTDLHLLPNRPWAEAYLRTRAVPQRRVERAMLDGYGLGDLCQVPYYAARLADRMLDETDGAVNPLGLLTEEQYAGVEVEATRSRIRREPLARWVRSVAVALELRGVSECDAEELDSLPGPGSTASIQARDRLAATSVLRDAPGRVTLQMKTTQDALCADAILKAGDPPAALRHVAVSRVEGKDCIRADADFMVDLVFEHADRDACASLRPLDELRWAKTVITRGDIEDGREALAVITEHVIDEGRSYGVFAEGLRSERGAVSDLGKRWPELVEERFDELVAQSADADPTCRHRALFQLSALRKDERTAGWLLPRLEDNDPQVVSLAASIARARGVTEAVGGLFDLLGVREERVGDAALQALTDLLPVERLPELACRVGSDHRLRPIAGRLLERLSDLDVALEFACAIHQLVDVGGWLLERIVESTPTSAWTEQRVVALIRACSNLAATSSDPSLYAAVFELHPDAALDAIVVHRTEHGTWVPSAQLRPLEYIDASHLEGSTRGPLRDALRHMHDEERQRTAHETDQQHRREELEAALEADPASVKPRAVTRVQRLESVSVSAKAQLLELANMWWREGALTRGPGEDELKATTEAVVRIGSALRPPLDPGRWSELLWAHAHAVQWRDYPLAEQEVEQWLKAVAPDDAHQRVGEMLRRVESGTAVIRLLWIGSSPRNSQRAFERLVELGPEAPDWTSVMLSLCEKDPERASQALSLDLSTQTRAYLVHSLASSQHVNVEATIESLRLHEADVRAGTAPKEAPHWWPSDAATPSEARQALMDLVRASFEQDNEEFATFALGRLASGGDREVLAMLLELEAAHPERGELLRRYAQPLMRQIARDDVLARLPATIGGIAAEFDRVAGAGHP